MSRLTLIAPDTALGEAQTLLAGVQSKLGMTPNMMRVMANSPAALNAYLQFSGALGKDHLPARLREKLALAVGEHNQCHYCLSAHETFARALGLADAELKAARRATDEDAKEQSALTFATRVLEAKGGVSDQDVAAVRGAGWSEAQVMEIVFRVVLNVLTNYVNRVAAPDLDFPAAASLPA